MKNEFLNFFKKRRSIRKFKDKKIEKKKINEIVKVLKYLPSSMNSQPWKIFFIDNKKIKKEIAEKLMNVHKYSYPILNAPLIAVITVDQKLSQKHFVEDGSIAAFSIWLAAANLGLGAVWIAIYNPSSIEREDIIRKILLLKENYRIISILAIGYPAEKPKNKKTKKKNEIIKFLK